MSVRTKKLLITIGLGVVVLPLAGAGIASAATPADDLGQGGSAVLATLENATASFLDAVNGTEPEGTEGTETEFPGADPRFVEGPAGGLVQDGPLR